MLRLLGLSCRMRAWHAREHVPSATPCGWGSYRDIESTCWRSVLEVTGTRGGARNITSCVPMGAVYTWNQVGALKFISPAPSSRLRISHGEPYWQIHQMSRLEGPPNSSKAKGYFPVVQQSCHVLYMTKWKGSGCAGSTTCYITTSGCFLVQAALHCFWAESKCYNSSSDARLSRSL